MADKLTPAVIELFTEMGHNANMINPIWTVTEAAKNGDSFSGSILRIVMSDDPDAGDTLYLSPHTMRFIVKLPPADARRRDSHFSSSHAFRREKFVFQNLLPAFNEFQHACRTTAISAQREPFEIFQSVPTCLFASDKDRAEYVVLRDLCKFGYANAERTEPLSEARVRLVLQRLAEFHAVSFAFKAQKPAKFERALMVNGVPQLREIMFERPVRPDLVACMEPNVQMVLEALAASVDQTDVRQLSKRLRQFGTDEFVETMARCCDTAQLPECVANEAVVLHGDCWISNLMFHESGKEMVFVDWQGARYGSVALDLSYFLFCCTDAKQRSKMDEMLRWYHGALVKRINVLGSDGEKLFPFERLLANMRECGVFGMGMAIMTLHATTCPSDQMANVAKTLDSGIDFTSVRCQMGKNPAYRRRIVGVCRDAVRLGYLSEC